MTKSLPFLALLLVLAVFSGATEPVDLGQGLAYLRVHSVATSEAALRKSVPGTAALVLDLRYATADDTAAGALRSALAARSPATLLLILVSPATPPALEPVITASSALTLGAPGSLPAPRIVVRTEAAADRRAYDALDAVTELSKLITGKIEKERFDEASLVQEFKNGHQTPEPSPGDRPDPTPAGQETGATPAPADAAAPKTETAPGKESPPAPPIDRVLQRAVHLHRALLALRR